MSGFFFCGMIELPVQYPSSRLTHWNCCEDHSTTSSESRDSSTASMQVTNKNSQT